MLYVIIGVLAFCMGIYLFCNELRKYGKLVENNEVDDCMSLEGLIGGLLLATFGAFLVLFTIALG